VRPEVLLVACVHTLRSAYTVAEGSPTAAARVWIRTGREPRFSSATARDPSASGRTHTWLLPEEEESCPWTPAGSWSIAISSELETAARLALVMRVRSVLIISGAASTAHMLSWLRNWPALIPWSGPR